MLRQTGITGRIANREQSKKASEVSEYVRQYEELNS
jgi:hypothetical protein